MTHWTMTKDLALRGLVAAAAREAHEEEPIGVRMGQFDSRGSRTARIDQLVDTLRNSDALFVLDEILNGAILSDDDA